MACAGSLLAVRRLLSAHRAQPYTLAEPPSTRTARVITKENTTMLIDFRVRPPYKTNLTTSLYNKPAPSSDPTKQSIFLIGKERVPSAEARSISAACSMSSSVANCSCRKWTRPKPNAP